MYVFATVLVLSRFIVLVATDGINVVSKEFNVKPGGQEHSFELKSHDFVCQFTYRCQGGTNEEWHMTITHDPVHTKQLTCTVERPSGVSYLYMQEFKLGSPGHVVTSFHAYGNSGVLMDDAADSSSGSVVQGATFTHELARVIAEFESEEVRNKRSPDDMPEL